MTRMPYPVLGMVCAYTRVRALSSGYVVVVVPGMGRALVWGMTNADFADEQLNASLSSAQVQKAREFLESFASDTIALRALVAVLCDQEALSEATVLESILENFAAVEAESA